MDLVRSTAALAVLFLALPLAATGCRFDPLPAPEPLPVTLQKTSARDALGARLPYRVRVTPIRGIAKLPVAQESSPDPTRHPSHPDATAVRQDLVKAFDESGLFTEVKAIGRAETGDEALDLAWGDGADLVLDVEITKYYQAFFGHENWAGWAFAYIAAIWPAWYVPVDFYAVGIEARVTLRNVADSGEPILSKAYVVNPENDKKLRQLLEPGEREIAGLFDLGEFLNVESSLQESNWASIDRCVAPFAWHDLHRQVLEDLATRLAKPLREGTPAERETVLKQVRKRFGVVVGVSKCADQSVPVTLNAAADARAFAELLEKPDGGGLVPGKTLFVLADEAATRSAVLEAVASLSSRASPSDEVVFYFAGLGSTLPRRAGAPPSAFASLGQAAPHDGTPVLLVHDAQAGALEKTALSLEDLGRAISALPVGRTAAFLDTSFSGPGQGTRTFDTGAGAEPLPRAIRRSFPKACVLAAASPGQAARALAENDSSIFAYVLRTGITSLVSREGRVTLGRLASFVHDEVESRAGLEGYLQQPQAEGAEEVELAWPR